LTIAVHNKVGLYVHRGSLVADVPGGRHERRGLRSSADRQFYVSVNKGGQPFAGSQVHVVHVGKSPVFVNGISPTDSSLFCCPSIFAQALRAAIVAAELPLRGKLRAEATTFFIDQRILEVVYQCLQALFVHDLILCWRPRIAPCSTHGQNCSTKPRLFCWVLTSDLESGGARCARRP